MSNTFRDGTVNIAAINNPGTYVDIIAPTPFATASSTAIEAFVGVASWGIPNALMTLSSPSDAASKVGLPQVRPYDIATCFAAAYSQGSQISGRAVRVTDGTDTAATVVVGTFGRFTAKSTGTLGNQIGVGFRAAAAPGAISAVVQFPGRIAETFDNVYQGLQSLTTIPGSGFTSVPTLTLSQPQYTKLGTFPATALATLTNVGTPAVLAGGTGHAVGDVLTLPNGLTLTVATVNAGAVSTVTVASPASIKTGAVGATAGVQVSSTGAGTGATFTIVWGLGPATVTNSGQGYTGAITATLTGGGAGATGGSYTPATSYGAALATAINNGTNQRAKSGYVVFTPGTSTGTPTINTVNQLSGGTDGASGVGTSQLLGLDVQPRTGMYALRSSGMDTFMLCDCHDMTVLQPMLALALDETSNFAFSTASGDTISGAVMSRVNAGLDDTNAWYITGDFPTFNDGLNGARLVDPAAFALGLAGNLSPEQSPINKALIGVQATQTSQSGIVTANADNSIAQEGGIDLIGRSASLGVTNFTFLTGRSTSSNTAARGIEYSRLTNFIARSLQGPATKAIVGKMQSTYRVDDPTRLLAKGTLDSFFATLKSPAFGSGGYGMIEDFANKCDLENNPPYSIQRGFLIAYSTALYLNAVRYFVVKFAGGGNITLTSGTSAASTAGAAIALLTSQGAGSVSST